MLRAVRNKARNFFRLGGIGGVDFNVLGNLARMVTDNETVMPDGVSALLITYGFKDQSDRPLDASEG